MPLKKYLSTTLVILALIAAYFFYLYNTSQHLVNQTLKKMGQLNSLSYSGSFTISIDKKTQNKFNYTFSGTSRGQNKAYAALQRTFKPQEVKYELVINNDKKTYIKNNNRWYPLANDQKAYYINPFIPLTISNILKPISSFSKYPLIKENMKINGYNVQKVKVTFDTDKSLETKILQYAKSNDNKQVKAYTDKLNSSGEYYLFIDPKTKFLHRLEVNLNIINKDKTYNYRTNYTFYNFNKAVFPVKIN
jgi:hypothetical protein